MNAHRCLCRGIPTTLALIYFGVLAGCAPTQVTQEKLNYAFWPLPPDEPRVQYLTSFQRSSDVTGNVSKFDQMIFGPEDDLPIVSPYSVAMWKGRIYVCDTRTPGVTVLDLKAKLTRLIGRSSAADMAKASDIAITPDGMKYVADIGKGTIVVFDANDHYLATFAPSGLNPAGIAVYGNELYVSDLKAQQVKVLDRSSGKVVRTIGGPGMNEGQFVWPLSVRLDKQGNLLVSDAMKAQIQAFSRDGNLLSTTGRMGRGFGELARPKHIAVDSNNFLYVVDAAFNNVQLFDENRKFLMYFGSAGPHPGAMDLPAGLCVDEDPEDVAYFAKYVHPAFQAERLVLITNQNGPYRVSVYAQGHLKAGKTLADISASRANVGAGLEKRGPASQPSGLPMISTPDNMPGPSSTTQPAAPTTLPGEGAK